MYLSFPCVHLYTGTYLFAGPEMPTAGVKSNIVKQECYTFPQRGFQHGGESLHMSYTYAQSYTLSLLQNHDYRLLTKRQWTAVSPASSGECFCVTGLRVNNMTIWHCCVRSYIPSVNIHTHTHTIKLFWNNLTLQKLCRTELRCILKTIILGRAEENQHCPDHKSKSHTKASTQCTGRFPWRTSSVPALNALLTFPPAVFDILGHAVHLSNSEREFSQYGLTGCRELMEILLK